MSVLLDKQEYVRVGLCDILKRYRGAILRGEEGTGKTWVAADVASHYDKTLMIAQAKAVKDIKAKISEYERASGNILDIEVISYHKFARLPKMPKADLFIFDECHELRNWKATWTKKFTRLKGDDFLFLSGTPLLKSPKDSMYILRKCGVINSTEEFRKYYFGAEPSKFGDFLEDKQFRNAEDFQTMLDKVCIELKHSDIDKDMPGLSYSIIRVPGTYEPPEDITKETKTRLLAGLSKVEYAGLAILEGIKNSGKNHALILCYFHETAKAMAEVLGCRIALNKEEVAKEFKHLAKNGGTLVTTLGLTSSSLDLNECDQVYLVESTYSYALDRQSINRCRRIGKKNEVQVTYFCLNGEHSVAKSFSRKYLTERMGRSRLSPSQLSILENCPGSFWLPTTSRKPEYVEAAVVKGHTNHAIVERYLHNPKIDLSDEVPEECVGMITECRKLIENCVKYGIETPVNLFTLHPEFQGTADFWSYNEKTKSIYVVDYKNGNSPVAVENNLQLIAYTLMIIHTYVLDVDMIYHTIWQKDKKKSCFYQKDMLRLWNKRVKRIIDNVIKAKDNPLDHLNPDPKCSFFCNARKYHQKQQEELEMAKTAQKSKTPTHLLTGFCTYSKKSKSKSGSGLLNVGISFKELPSSLKNLYKAGSKQMKILQKSINYSKEYGTFSLFSLGVQGRFKGSPQITKGEKIEMSISVAQPKEDSGYDKATFFIQEINPVGSSDGWNDDEEESTGSVENTQDVEDESSEDSPWT